MWNGVNPDHLQALSYFDELMKRLDVQRPFFLPDFSHSSRLFVASDFTGDHGASPYSTFTFVVVSAEAIAEWDRHRRRWRADHKLNERRIGFARLTDRRKRAACAEFIYLANAMSGLAVTVLIDKRIKSLFLTEGMIVPRETTIETLNGPLRFDAWKPAAFERMLRAVHLVALFVAGLSSPVQDIYWITDEDDIAPNVARLTDLTAVFAHVLSALLTHNVRHIRVGTTGTTAGDDLRMEDYAAIADLIAGSLNDYMISHHNAGDELSPIITLAPDSLPRKTRSLVAMLFEERAPLRKLTFAIDSEADSNRLRFRQLRMHLEPFVVIG